MTQLTNYIGTKIVGAMPEKAGNGAEGYRLVYANGYTSWSPKEAFEEAYRKTDAMTFGDALVMLKAGQRVARAGWNGKGMWLHIVQSASCDLKVKLFGPMNYPSARSAPFIGMKTADDKFVPWLASQTDMLAEDWQVVE